MSRPQRLDTSGTFFLTAITAIHHNPVRAHLCQFPEQYPYSAAHHPQPASAAEASSD